MRLEQDIELLRSDASKLEKKPALQRVLCFIEECKEKSDIDQLQKLSKQGLPSDVVFYIRRALQYVSANKKNQEILKAKKQKISAELKKLQMFGLWTDEPNRKSCALCLGLIKREISFVKSPDQEYYNLQIQAQRAIERARIMGIR